MVSVILLVKFETRQMTGPVNLVLTLCARGPFRSSEPATREELATPAYFMGFFTFLT